MFVCFDYYRCRGVTICFVAQRSTAIKQRTSNQQERGGVATKTWVAPANRSICQRYYLRTQEQPARVPSCRAGITAGVRGLAEQEKGSGPARSGSLGGKGRDGGEQKVGGEQEDAEGAERGEDERVEAEDNSESSDERRARRR